MSKGSAQRPRSIADEEWASRWNSIFGKDNVEEFKESAKQETTEVPSHVPEDTAK